jgi:hypothetical protein
VVANLRFAHGIAASLHLWPYSRGDAGALSEGQFKALLADWNRRICAWAGGMGSEPRRTRVAGNDLMRKGWVKGPYAITLGWSSSGHSRRDFRAEYVQIEVAPFGPGHGPVRLPGATVAESPAAKVAGRIAARKVVRRQDGDVCLEGLPMVDQGRKGYCAAAAAERILRFYGMDVSQHVIAQLADSDRSRGTNPQLMLGELRRAGQKFGVKVREHYSGVDTFAKLEDLMNNYNLAARENRAERVTLPNVGVTDLAQVYASLAPAPFRQARCENQRVEYRKFLADLRDRIGKGIPLLWSVYLGTFAETPALPPGEGFHMRVIIGYNDRTQTVIYSDSWGAGHEFKKMPFDRAWTITTGLYSFDPRR